MNLDIWHIYENMLCSRLFEQAVIEAWRAGEISGEMHLSTGEEAIVAGTVLQLQEGDALALDHRGTSPLVMRGLDLNSLFREFLGRPDGLCGGMGGHMHLFSKEHLAASSGIVGAAGPAAAGFALAARYLRPKAVALAYFGDGAMNQGMLMESFNLAVAWKLPAIFICKDSKWAITTVSASVTGGDILKRAEAFGMPTERVDGMKVEEVWKAAAQAFERARSGKGPSFILASCIHPEGHFLGDPLLRIARQPLKEISKIAGPLLKAVIQPGGATLSKRTGSLGKVTSIIGKSTKDQAFSRKDPLKAVRKKLKEDTKRLENLEKKLAGEVAALVASALGKPEETTPIGPE